MKYVYRDNKGNRYYSERPVFCSKCKKELEEPYYCFYGYCVSKKDNKFWWGHSTGVFHYCLGCASPLLKGEKKGGADVVEQYFTLPLEVVPNNAKQVDYIIPDLTGKKGDSKGDSVFSAVDRESFETVDNTVLSNRKEVLLEDHTPPELEDKRGDVE